MKILFITTHYPPNNTGASTVMHNLISNLDQKTVAGVVTHANNFNNIDEKMDDINIHYIFHEINCVHPSLKYYLRQLFFKRAIKKVQRIIEKYHPTHLVCVYPDLDFIDLGIELSKINPNIKFIPYLHDTIAEGLSYKRHFKRAKKIQDYLIKNNKNILVMSDGMKDLFKKKYSILTTPILHSFSENIDKTYF